MDIVGGIVELQGVDDSAHDVRAMFDVIEAERHRVSD